MRATITREEAEEKEQQKQSLALGKTHSSSSQGFKDNEERKRHNMAEQAYAQQLRESLEKKGAWTQALLRHSCFIDWTTFNVRLSRDGHHRWFLV